MNEPAKKGPKPDGLSKYSLFRLLALAWIPGSCIFIALNTRNFWHDNEQWGFWSLIGLTFIGGVIYVTDEFTRYLTNHFFKNKLDLRLFIFQFCIVLFVYLRTL